MCSYSYDHFLLHFIAYRLFSMGYTPYTLSEFQAVNGTHNLRLINWTYSGKTFVSCRGCEKSARGLKNVGHFIQQIRFAKIGSENASGFCLAKFVSVVRLHSNLRLMWYMIHMSRKTSFLRMQFVLKISNPRCVLKLSLTTSLFTPLLHFLPQWLSS